MGGTKASENGELRRKTWAKGQSKMADMVLLKCETGSRMATVLCPGCGRISCRYLAAPYSSGSMAELGGKHLCPICAGEYCSCSTAEAENWASAFTRYRGDATAYNLSVERSYVQKGSAHRAADDETASGSGDTEQAEPESYWCCEVVLHGTDLSFPYLSDEGQIAPGTAVLIPLGNRGIQKTGIVRQCRKMKAEEIPCPIERKSFILRILKEDESGTAWTDPELRHVFRAPSQEERENPGLSCDATNKGAEETGDAARAPEIGGTGTPYDEERLLRKETGELREESAAQEYPEAGDSGTEGAVPGEFTPVPEICTGEPLDEGSHVIRRRRRRTELQEAAEAVQAGRDEISSLQEEGSNALCQDAGVPGIIRRRRRRGGTETEREWRSPGTDTDAADTGGTENANDGQYGTVRIHPDTEIAEDSEKQASLNEAAIREPLRQELPEGERGTPEQGMAENERVEDSREDVERKRLETSVQTGLENMKAAGDAEDRKEEPQNGSEAPDPVISLPRQQKEETQLEGQRPGGLADAPLDVPEETRKKREDKPDVEAQKLPDSPEAEEAPSRGQRDSWGEWEKEARSFNEGRGQRRPLASDRELIAYLKAEFDKCTLLGEIELYRFEYDHLLVPLMRKKAAFLLKNRIVYPDRVLAVGMVQVGIWEYDNAEYWRKLLKILELDGYGHQMITLLGECFEQTLKSGGKPVYRDKERVATILMHGVVAECQLPRLLDFLYAYYSLDLGGNLEEARFLDVKEAMTQGGYYKRQQYILSQTEKAMELSPLTGARIMGVLLGWIDCAYYDIDFVARGDRRLAGQFMKWKSRHRDFSGQMIGDRKKKSRGERHFASPVLRVNYIEDRLEVLFPPQNLPMEQGMVEWDISGAVEAKAWCHVREGALQLHTEEMLLPVESCDLFGRFVFCLMVNGKCRRKFELEGDCCRFFDTEGSLIPRGGLREGEVCIFTKKGEEMDIDAPYDEIPSGWWNVHRYRLSNGSLVGYPDGTRGIVGGTPQEGLCYGKPVEGVRFRSEEGREMRIYAAMPRYLLRTTPERFAQGRLTACGKFTPLRGLPCVDAGEIDRDGEHGYLITLPLDEGMQGPYAMSISIPGDRRVRQEEFAVLEGFGIRFESESPLPYLFAPRGSVTVFGNLTLSGKGMMRHETRNEFGFELDGDRDELVFDVEGTRGQIQMEIPVVRYRIGSGEWKNTQMEPMWHTEVPDWVEFRTGLRHLSLQVDDNPRQRLDFSGSTESQVIHCDILPLVQWMDREKDQHLINLVIGESVHPFMKVLTRSRLIGARIEAESRSGHLSCVMEIEGKGRYCATISSCGKILADMAPVSDGRVETQSEVCGGEYDIQVFEEEEDEFGLNLCHHLIGQTTAVVIDPGNLSGRRFWLKRIETLDRKPHTLEFVPRRYQVERVRTSDRGNGWYMATITDTFKSEGEARHMQVQIHVPSTERIDRMSINLCDTEGHVQPFLYDYGWKELTAQEDERLHRMQRYRRYTMLDSEDIIQVVYSEKEEER